MGRLVDDHNKAIYCDALEDENEYVGKKLDLVEVVRCKDCKYRVVNEHYGKKGYLPIKAMCDLDTADPFSLGRCAEEDYWFCADGERREDD